jgi:hypothetical protein
MDLGVAVVGGIAGAIAIIRNMSGVMVGVAIATALVPPLATVGFGIVTGRADFATVRGLAVPDQHARHRLCGDDCRPHQPFRPIADAATYGHAVGRHYRGAGVLSIPLAISLDNIGREVRARAIVQSELSGCCSRRDRVENLNVA